MEEEVSMQKRDRKRLREYGYDDKTIEKILNWYN
jgi:hypothetical protein